MTRAQARRLERQAVLELELPPVGPLHDGPTRQIGRRGRRRLPGPDSWSDRLSPRGRRWAAIALVASITVGCCGWFLLQPGPPTSDAQTALEQLTRTPPPAEVSASAGGPTTSTPSASAPATRVGAAGAAAGLLGSAATAIAGLGGAGSSAAGPASGGSAGSGVTDSSAAGSGAPGSGVAGSGVAGSGVAGSGVAGSGAGGSADGRSAGGSNANGASSGAAGAGNSAGGNGAGGSAGGSGSGGSASGGSAGGGSAGGGSAGGGSAGGSGGNSTLRIGLAYSDTLPWATSSRRAAGIDDAVQTNSGWVRMDLPWLHIQPDNSSQWLWSRYDPTVEAVRARGLNILFTIQKAPPWARDSSCSADPTCPPASDAAFATFVGAVAKHYGAMGIHALEIWNEPNLKVFWKDPDAARYGRLLAAAARAAHANDSSSEVIIGGLAAAAPGSPVLDQLEFLRGICATGACALVDGVGYHPYTFPVKASLRPTWTTPWTRISRDSPSIRSVLQQAGAGSLPIWLTEFGAPTGGPGRESDGSPERADSPTDHVSESVQAALAADAVATAGKDSQIVALFYYQDWDNAGLQPDREGYFGLRRADGSAKPAFSAFADAVARLRSGN